MIKVRIEGLPDEVQGFIELLQREKGISILNESGQFPNRGKSSYVRSYLDVEYTKAAKGKKVQKE